MKVRWLILLAALVCSIASSAQAQETRGLAPSTRWNLNYDDDSCALRRMFGEGSNQAYLEFRRFGPLGSLQTTVSSNRMKPTASPAAFRYQFENADTDWHKVERAPTITMAKEFAGVIFRTSFIGLPDDADLSDPATRAAFQAFPDWAAAESAFGAKTQTLVLHGAFRRDLVLQVGSMQAPVEALNKCVDELMTHWGIDVEAHKTLTRPAIPINLPQVGRMIDYPPKMLRQSMPGLVNIRLAIDEHGGITGCHIQMPLSDPSFEETSCADVQHAIEFEPALDKDGKPIASYWITTVNFQIAD